MIVDSAGWTGEGTFTPVLLEALQGVETIEFLRVEDAPASRADAGYALISNEIYVRFRTTRRVVSSRLGGLLQTRADVPVMTLGQLGERLGTTNGIGEPDYQDDGMLQFLRTEVLVAPYQTKGVKVVELVRVYEVGTPYCRAVEGPKYLGSRLAGPKNNTCRRSNHSSPPF